MLGYCTNVHAGADLDTLLASLSTHASAVRSLHAPEQDLPIGLWMSAAAAEAADANGLRDELARLHLEVFTINGFPYGDFHGPLVGHGVYEPDWTSPKRLAYTLRLAELLAVLVERGTSAGISTLPLGWKEGWSGDEAAAAHLRTCITHLVRLEDDTGRCIHVDLEAEPGCRLERAADVADFVNAHFGDDELTRRHLRVCHDTCHSAVMRESAEEAVSAYASAGMMIGKVQVSSAIDVDFGPSGDAAAIESLGALAEPRYLHQVTIEHDGTFAFHENLADMVLDDPRGHWRIHYHVPVHQEHFGVLGTTQSELVASIPVLAAAGATDWEVETYTWDVHPRCNEHGSLAESIAGELAWTAHQLAEVGQ